MPFMPLNSPNYQYTIHTGIPFMPLNSPEYWHSEKTARNTGISKKQRGIPGKQPRISQQICIPFIPVFKVCIFLYHWRPYCRRLEINKKLITNCKQLSCLLRVEKKGEV